MTEDADQAGGPVDWKLRCYREILRAGISNTVGADSEVDDELSLLMNALSS